MLAAVTAPSSYLVTPQNQHVLPARPGEVRDLLLGPSLRLDVPLLAAPMAGITAAPLRMMYNQAGARVAISEMVIASALQSGSAASRHLARFHHQEALRSVQLYGVRPDALDWACRFLIQEVGVHHIDLNFGCPVRKVTSKGGGAALPLRPRLLQQLVAAAVEASVQASGGAVPVTVKVRMGLTPQLLTYQQVGVTCADHGVAALTLHARTADQQYSPPAHWEAVRQLVDAVPPHLPVIGNGDIFEAADAVRLIRETGCRGVMIGRAALGRPWLFSEAADMLSGRWPARPPPVLGEVLGLALQHLQAWVDWEQDELSAVLKMRKLIPCYLAGFPSASRNLQAALFAAKSVAHWEAAVADPDRLGFDPRESLSMAALRKARLKGSGQIRAQQHSESPCLWAGWMILMQTCQMTCCQAWMKLLVRADGRGGERCTLGALWLGFWCLWSMCCCC